MANNLTNILWLLYSSWTIVCCHAFTNTLVKINCPVSNMNGKVTGGPVVKRLSDKVFCHNMEIMGSNPGRVNLRCVVLLFKL